MAAEQQELPKWVVFLGQPEHLFIFFPYQSGLDRREIDTLQANSEAVLGRTA